MLDCLGSNSVYVTNQYHAVWGGALNYVCSGNRSNIILGGRANCIYCEANAATNAYNVIAGGSANRICSAVAITCFPSLYNVILGGENSYIRSANGCAYANVVMGGKGNIINRRSFSAAMGDSITIGGNFSFGFGATKTVLRNTAHFDAIEKTTNNFRIPHPNPCMRATHHLIHTSVESPTAGDTLYRYDATTVGGRATIELPGYFIHLNERPQVWTTPTDNFGSAFGTISGDMKSIELYSDVDGTFHVLVVATRKDFDGVNAWRGAETLKPL